MCLLIKAGSLLVGLGGIFPDVPVCLIMEESGIAGVLRVQIYLAGLDSIANDAGRAELQAVLNRNVRFFKGLQDHLAQHCAFRIDLGRHHHWVSSHSRPGDHSKGKSRCAVKRKDSGHGYSSHWLAFL